tara:strand:+ start:234 stop:542 length:309 start_codon:yes stop_codon:yes gene_type:complete
MRTIEISAEQFEQVVYLACATATAEDVQQLRLSSKVLDKLESKALEKPDGQGFKLMNDIELFEFEDTEADFVLKRIEEMIPSLQTWASRKILPVIDQLTASE